MCDSTNLHGQHDSVEAAGGEEGEGIRHEGSEFGVEGVEVVDEGCAVPGLVLDVIVPVQALRGIQRKRKREKMRERERERGRERERRVK